MGRPSSNKVALCAFILVVSPLFSSAGDFQDGIDMFSKAGRGVCWVENKHKLHSNDDKALPCYSRMLSKDDDWQSRYDFQFDFNKQYYSPEAAKNVSEKYALDYLKSEIKNDYLTKIPSAYKLACEKFVDKENQKPANNYSTILQDSSKGDYPFRGLAHCLIGEIGQIYKGDDLIELNSYWLNPEDFMKAVQYGLKMFTKAGRGVCWVEKHNKVPPNNGQGINYGTCHANMEFDDNEWQSKYNYHSVFQKQQGFNHDTLRELTEEYAMRDLKTLMKSNYISQLPSAYKYACEQFVDFENQKPTRDYSNILQDSSKRDYPFKGLAHCLIGTIEQNNRADDLVALNSFWVNPEGKEDFKVTILPNLEEKREKENILSDPEEKVNILPDPKEKEETTNILLVDSPPFPRAEDIQYGIEMFAKAGRGVCWVENRRKLHPNDEHWMDCFSQMRFKDNDWQSRYDFQFSFNKEYYKDPDTLRTVSEKYAMYYLKSEMKNGYLTKLPSAYKSACEQFVVDENQKPAKDFSTTLQDSPKAYYPFRGLAHCLIGKIEETNTDELNALESYWLNPDAYIPAVQYGIGMFTKAGRGVCWVEMHNKLKPIDEKGIIFSACHDNMGLKENGFQSKYDYHADFNIQQGYNPDSIRALSEAYAMMDLKTLMKSNYLIQLPSAYRSACKEFVDDENKKAEKEYPTILQDSAKRDYPFKGLAHCLIAKIEENNKADDLDALNSHWLNPKPFEEAMIDRENKNRALHDVSMLTLDSELNLRAQRYAEDIAEICDLVHAARHPKYGGNHPDLWYNGEWTGENLGQSATTFLTDSENGVDIANSFYDEMKKYPWPYFTGNNADFMDIGHFTQSVWKSTTFAGYGVARNEAYPLFKVYVVARYFPAGNYPDKFKDNVLPPLY